MDRRRDVSFHSSSGNVPLTHQGNQVFSHGPTYSQEPSQREGCPTNVLCNPTRDQVISSPFINQVRVPSGFGPSQDQGLQAVNNIMEQISSLSPLFNTVSGPMDVNNIPAYEQEYNRLVGYKGILQSYSSIPGILGQRALQGLSFAQLALGKVEQMFHTCLRALSPQERQGIRLINPQFQAILADL